MKVCNTCHISKPNNAYGLNSAKTDLLQAICKPCLSEQRKLARQKNPDIYKQQWKRNKYSTKESSEYRRLLSSYGITPAMKEVYSRIIGGKCEICGCPTKLVVDHNHRDGQFRGLLCSKCNRGLGHFDDNIELIEKAIEYLRK